MIFNILYSVTPYRVDSVPAVVRGFLSVELLGALGDQVFQILVILDEISVAKSLFDFSNGS